MFCRRTAWCDAGRAWLLPCHRLRGGPGRCGRNGDLAAVWHLEPVSGMADAALLEKLARLTEGIGRDHDHLVLDTAPTGHTLTCCCGPR